MSGSPRRVVVTGIGLVTPLATNARGTFQRLLRGETALVPLRRAPFFLPNYLSEDKKIPTSEKKAMLSALIDAMPSKVAGAVIEKDEDTYYYDYEKAENTARRRALRFAPTAHEPRGFRFCAAAVEEALRDALLLHPISVEKCLGTSGDTSSCSDGNKDRVALIGIGDPRRVGVNIGMGIPSLSDVTDVTAALTGELKATAASATGGAPTTAPSHRVQYSKINPFFVPKILGNMAAGATAIKYNCQGFIGSSVAACATGAHCIGESFLVLRQRPQQMTSTGTTPTTVAAAFNAFMEKKRSSQAPSASSQVRRCVDESDGVVEVMICGATEACITPVSIGGFSRMRALSTKHNQGDDSPSDAACDTGGEGGPSTASRPFDASRDGFVMGEGAGILILEEYDHARTRIARYLEDAKTNVKLDDETRAFFAGRTVEDYIYGEVKGFGVSCDAHHVAAPHPQGRGAEACLRNCLASGNVFQDVSGANTFYTPKIAPTAAAAATADSSSDLPASHEEESFAPLRIGYVNAHATGTIGDEVELGAIQRVFGSSSSAAAGEPAASESTSRAGSRLVVSSTKGSLGHLLGAAGSVEAAIALLALREQVAPPTANLRSPCMNADEQARSGVVLNATAAPLEACDAVVSTSFGFGGINTALLFTKV